MTTDSRTLPGHCPTCGYWLRGSADDAKLAGLLCTCPPANGRAEVPPATKPTAKRGRSKRGGQDA